MHLSDSRTIDPLTWSVAAALPHSADFKPCDEPALAIDPAPRSSVSGEVLEVRSREVEHQSSMGAATRRAGRPTPRLPPPILHDGR